MIAFDKKSSHDDASKIAVAFCAISVCKALIPTSELPLVRDALSSFFLWTFLHFSATRSDPNTVKNSKNGQKLGLILLCASVFGLRRDTHHLAILSAVCVPWILEVTYMAHFDKVEYITFYDSDGVKTWSRKYGAVATAFAILSFAMLNTEPHWTFVDVLAPAAFTAFAIDTCQSQRSHDEGRGEVDLLSGLDSKEQGVRHGNPQGAIAQRLLSDAVAVTTPMLTILCYVFVEKVDIESLGIEHVCFIVGEAFVQALHLWLLVYSVSHDEAFLHVIVLRNQSC